ncbi:MAG: 4Fe-4S dicluster domain-containing protein [Candidatus Methanofastidiosia archaeon]
MVKWGMVIDLDKCTACQACVVACKVENSIPFAEEHEEKGGRTIFWMAMISVIEGEYPNLKATFIPRPCMHCENPPCTRVCPVGATYLREEDGLVMQDYHRCIGCRYCTVACPYTVKSFNWYSPKWPEPMDKYLNPDVPKRFTGVVEKCSFCEHRIQKAKKKAEGEGRELRDGDVVPACVQTCPSNAIYFGDLDDPDSVVSKLEKSPRAFKLLEDLGTKPKVIYLKSG